MLGWVLRRGFENATGANGEAEDTTQIEQPDTPGPVFAARALKSAIFGTPARPHDESDLDSDNMARSNAITTEEMDLGTPPKPQGILLTPGTGTSRRKRVSFGHDVLDRAGKRSKGKGVDERPGAFPSTFLAKDGDSCSKRTKLTETMANSRRSKSSASTTGSKKPGRTRKDEDAEDEWEEADDDHCTHDITIDLNEPHSRSGKYWKTEFEQYHQDAKVEMEKLLKYKQLAKSYAKMKDAEAINLHEKLMEEQGRVVQMEKRITEMASQMASRRLKGEDTDNPQFMKDLAKQTALAVQYRNQVKELEALMKDDQDDGETDAKGKRRRLAASPRTQRTLVETQRELRRARVQVKENGELREQVEQLRSDLERAENRAKLAEETKRQAEDQPLNTQKWQDLRVQVKKMKEEALQKDQELRNLQKEFDDFKTETAARQEDTKRVLEKATDKISDLKKEIKALRAGTTDAGRKPKTSSGSSDQFQPSRQQQDMVMDRAASSELSNERHNKTGRRSLDLVESLSRKLNEDKRRSLREHFEGDAEVKPQADKEEAAKDVPNILADRVNLGMPRWRPFIPRSPRNREYLGPDLNKRIISSSAIPSGTTPAPRSRFKDSDEPQIDLLQDRFARLGVPDVNSSAFISANMSRSALAPERRAAAIARIEQRKAEKSRALADDTYNKENMRP